jgi:hypothetical protein
MSGRQRYRMRAPSTGRELILEAEPERVYVDRDTGEELEVVGKVLPLAPSELDGSPWAVENLRFCPWCEQLAQKDLNDCPTCGRRMGPVGVRRPPWTPRPALAQGAALALSGALRRWRRRLRRRP